LLTSPDFAVRVSIERHTDRRDRVHLSRHLVWRLHDPGACITMTNVNPWDTIHQERAALAADLADLDGARWQTRSACGDWTVQQVLGHMTAAAATTPATWLVRFAGTGFRFNTLISHDIATQTAGGPEQTLARFRAIVDSSGHPPGPVDSWLGETMVHAEDIRRPLGIAHDYPTEPLTRLAGFYAGSNLLIGAKKRVAGLTLRTTDADWSTGSGPEVAGPAIAIVLAMTGRTEAIDELAGDGVDTLRSRA
jgi:uncharacterized protein (TIGR03083 family)